MLRDEVTDLLNRIPVLDHTRLVFVLAVGTSVNMDLLVRMEKNYLVLRGRESGSNDEGRGFFIPYEQIGYIKLERMVRVNEFRAMYGEPLETVVGLGDDADEAPGAATAGVGATTPAPVGPAPAMAPTDIAKQNLLDRIRAARTSAGAPRLRAK